jgi:hypothetical protein
MYRRFRQKFGTAGLLVAAIALVLAMVTGAYAAGGGLSAKQKKQVKSIAKGLVGTGPEGKQGPAGTNGTPGEKGAKGDPGTNGTDGTNGTNGTSVVSSTEPAGANCTNGGSKFVAGASTTYACNGANGQTGFTDTLPAGKTETGTYVTGNVAGFGIASISFNIPLANPLDGSHVHYSSEAGFATACPGSFTAPSVANNSNLCVYSETQEGTFLGIAPEPLSGVSTGANSSGAFVAFTEFGTGSWAVKGP